MEEQKIHFLPSRRVHARPLTRRLRFPFELAVVVLRQGPLASVVYPWDNLPPRVLPKGTPCPPGVDAGWCLKAATGGYPSVDAGWCLKAATGGYPSVAAKRGRLVHS